MVKWKPGARVTVGIIAIAAITNAICFSLVFASMLCDEVFLRTEQSLSTIANVALVILLSIIMFVVALTCQRVGDEYVDINKDKTLRIELSIMRRK